MNHCWKYRGWSSPSYYLFRHRPCLRYIDGFSNQFFFPDNLLRAGGTGIHWKSNRGLHGSESQWITHLKFPSLNSNQAGVFLKRPCNLLVFPVYHTCLRILPYKLLFYLCSLLIRHMFKFVSFRLSLVQYFYNTFLPRRRTALNFTQPRRRVGLVPLRRCSCGR